MMDQEQLEKLTSDLLYNSADNKRLSSVGIPEIFQPPLLGIADGADSIFDKFKTVVGPLHLTPLEMWLGSGYEKPDGGEKALRVVSIAFPFSPAIRDTYKQGDEFPSALYSLGRHFADALIADVLSKIISRVGELGYDALDASGSPLFQLHNGSDIAHVYSTWSERHIAFAAGLGTFSLHEGLITKAGCNVRLGSFITNLPLEVTPRASDAPYGNCLFYQDGSCMKCAAHCPVSAISAQGHDKKLCLKYRNIARDEMKKRILRYSNILYSINEEGVQALRAGCALCQFDVPCMDRIP